MHRRKYLATTGVILKCGTGGCVFGGHSIKSGALVISNDQNVGFEVLVTVRKVSSRVPETQINSDSNSGNTPVEEPIWRREEIYEITGNGRIEESEFISEAGIYQFEVSVGDIGTETAIKSFGKGADGGVTRGSIYISIYEYDHFTISFPVN